MAAGIVIIIAPTRIDMKSTLPSENPTLEAPPELSFTKPNVNRQNACVNSGGTLGEKDRRNRMYEVVGRERVGGGHMLADDQHELLGKAVRKV